MRQINLVHTIHCDVDTFWKTFFDEDFMRPLYEQALGVREMEVLEKTDTKRRLRIVPDLKGMPGPARKALGDKFAYEEHGTLDRDTNTWRWHLVPSSMRDKLKTAGTFRIEPKGEGECERIDEATVEAKIFGIGKLFEGFTEKEVRATFEKEVEFMNKWLAERG